jgi:signal peptidase II
MTVRRNRWLAVAIVAVVAADWLTKFWVQNRLFVGSLMPVVRGWLWFTHHENPGVSFSMLANAPAAVRLPFIVAAAVAGIAACVHMLRSTDDPRIAAAAALVIAGALGNLGDRLLNGAVTDFIQVRFFPYIFNVADVSITAGAILLAVALLRESRSPAEPTPVG